MGHVQAAEKTRLGSKVDALVSGINLGDHYLAVFFSGKDLVIGLSSHK